MMNEKYYGGTIKTNSYSNKENEKLKWRRTDKRQVIDDLRQSMALGEQYGEFLDDRLS